MKRLMEAFIAKFLCTHDFETRYRAEGIYGSVAMLLVCKKCGKTKFILSKGFL